MRPRLPASLTATTSRPQLALLGLVFGLSLWPQPAQAFTPRWEEGLTWTVSTIYRESPQGRSRKKEIPHDQGWSDPTNWVFLVSRVQQIEGITYYLVRIKDREHASSALASLIFASGPPGDGDSPLSLLRGKFLRAVRSEKHMSEATWNEPGDNPRPVPAEQSIIPYDFPSFPLVDPGTDKPRSRLFEITQELPPLKFAKDILQREQTGLEPNRYAGKDIQERSGFKGMDPKQMIFVELSRKMDGYASRQIWAPELPWPLYSDNGNSRSVLIFHSLEARSTRSTPKTTGSTGAGDGPAPQGSETVRDEDAETR